MKRVYTLLIILLLLGAPVYGFVAAATPLTYDSPPQSQPEFLAITAVFSSLPPAQQLQSAKPRWENPVSSSIVPPGWRCELVDWDDTFGADYYTFFPTSTLAATTPMSPNTSSNLGSTINASSGNVRITLSGDITLGAVINIASGKNVTLCSANPGSPVTLYQGAANNRHFTVSAGGSLTLEDIILDGSNTGGGVAVSGSLTMNAGAVIKRCRHTPGVYDQAGGVAVLSGGTFTMHSGKITDCSSYDAGGVSVTQGQFTLYGGIISGNKSTGLQGYGGGVYAGTSGTFTMNGGLLRDNLSEGASSLGGGVLVYAGGFTMRDGIIKGNTAVQYGGGVCVADGGNFTMSGGLLRGNSAADYGGGVCVSGGGTILFQGGAVIDRNQAANGGGVYIKNTALTFRGGARFTGNQASQKGGGLLIEGTSTLTASGGEISGNEAQQLGGGIHSDGANASIDLTDCLVSQNRAGDGAGISAFGSPITVTGGLISENASTYSGGGLYLWYGTLTLQSGARVEENTAMYGGGVYASYSTVAASDASIVLNKATQHGGGLYLDNAPTPHTLNGSAIEHNTAANGGGLYSDGAVTVTGGLFYGNTATTGSGGGLYITGTGSLTVNGGCRIDQNRAPARYGGGIYTEKYTYSNLDLASSVDFRRNSASRDFPPPANAEAMWGGYIKTTSSSLAEYDFPVNNCDINAFPCTVTFNTDGGSAVPNQTVAKGGNAAEPVPPVKSGYILEGWYKDSGCTTPWNFAADAVSPDAATYVTSITLYAKWETGTLNVRIPVKLLWMAFEDDNDVISPDYQVINDSVFPIDVSGMLIASDDYAGEGVTLVSGTPGSSQLRLDILGGNSFSGLAPGQDNPFSATISGLLMNGADHAFGYLGGTVYDMVSGTAYGTTGWFRIGGQYGGPKPATALKPVYGMQFSFESIFPEADSTSLPIQAPADPAKGFTPRVPAPYNVFNDFRCNIIGTVCLLPLGWPESVELTYPLDFPGTYWQLKNIIYPSITDYSGMSVSTDDPLFDGTFSIGPDRFGRPSIICSYFPDLQAYTEWVTTYGIGSSPEYTVEVTLTQGTRSATFKLTVMYNDSVLVIS